MSKSEFYFLKISHTPHLAHLSVTVTEQTRTGKRELRGGAIFHSPQLCAVLMPLKWSPPQGLEAQALITTSLCKDHVGSPGGHATQTFRFQTQNEAHTVLPGERHGLILSLGTSRRMSPRPPFILVRRKVAPRVPQGHYRSGLNPRMKRLPLALLVPGSRRTPSPMGALPLALAGQGAAAVGPGREATLQRGGVTAPPRDRVGLPAR